MENFPHRPQGSVLRGKYCYVEFHPEHSPLFSDVLCSHVTSFHAFCPHPFEILTPPPVSIALPPHSCVSTTFIIPIMDTLCPGYHGTISEPFRQSWNGIGSITDSFRHLYHLNHASTLKEVSVLYLLFQSLLLLHTSPLSCSIKGLDIL